MPPTDDQRTEEPGRTGALTPPPPSAAPAVPLLPPDPANQRRSVAGLLVALLSLSGLLGLDDLSRGIYMAMFAVLAGVVALWLSVTAAVRARRERTQRPPASVTATVIASAGIVMGALMLTAFTALGTQLAGYGQCLSGASTISAQRSCQSQFTRAVNRKLTALRGAGAP